MVTGIFPVRTLIFRGEVITDLTVFVLQVPLYPPIIPVTYKFVVGTRKFSKLYDSPSVSSRSSSQNSDLLLLTRFSTVFWGFKRINML